MHGGLTLRYSVSDGSNVYKQAQIVYKTTMKMNRTIVCITGMGRVGGVMMMVSGGGGSEG